MAASEILGSARENTVTEATGKCRSFVCNFSEGIVFEGVVSFTRVKRVNCSGMAAQEGITTGTPPEVTTAHRLDEITELHVVRATNETALVVVVVVDGVDRDTSLRREYHNNHLLRTDQSQSINNPATGSERGKDLPESKTRLCEATITHHKAQPSFDLIYLTQILNAVVKCGCFIAHVAIVLTATLSFTVVSPEVLSASVACPAAGMTTGCAVPQ